VEIEEKKLSIRLVVEKGLIAEAEVGGDYFEEEKSQKLNFMLKGRRHIMFDLNEVMFVTGFSDSFKMIGNYF
jgi:hypothetical protein